MRGAEFLSTPSVRRATASQVRPPKLLDISIHALREEGDCLIVRQRGPAQDFYPRPPRGGRPVTLGCSHIRGVRHVSVEFDVKCTNISIHALREEGDCPVRVGDLRDIEISIHALREEGDYRLPAIPHRQLISIHALREEGDGRLRYFGHQAEIISIHALREEGDDKHALVVKLLKIFLSTPSARRATIPFRLFMSVQ